MHGIAGRLRKIFASDRGSGRWVIGLVVVAAAALLLWLGLGPDRGGPEAGAPVSAGADILPPAEEDVDPAATFGPDSQPRDVIPPAEP
ncbi:MAG: hypothetical protein AB7S71_22975 [Dongiaceae bacterium]